MRAVHVRRVWTVRVLAIVGITLALYAIFVPRLSWDGACAASFVIRVSDATNGQPIEGAAVHLRRTDSSGQPLSPATEAARHLSDLTTNSAGEASTTYGFGAGGMTGVFGRSGTVGFGHHAFVVSEPGYETVKLPIEEFTGRSRSIRSSLNFDISIKLSPLSG